MQSQLLMHDGLAHLWQAQLLSSCEECLQVFAWATGTLKRTNYRCIILHHVPLRPYLLCGFDNTLYIKRPITYLGECPFGGHILQMNQRYTPGSRVKVPDRIDSSVCGPVHIEFKLYQCRVGLVEQDIEQISAIALSELEGVIVVAEGHAALTTALSNLIEARRDCPHALGVAQFGSQRGYHQEGAADVKAVGNGLFKVLLQVGKPNMGTGGLQARFC